MLLFSSAAVLGNPGQSDYATANGFMDSYAAYRNQQVALGNRFGRTMAINWPYWSDGGMKLNADQLAQLEQHQTLPLTVKQGLDISHYCLQLSEAYSQILVIPQTQAVHLLPVALSSMSATSNIPTLTTQVAIESATERTTATSLSVDEFRKPGYRLL